jgi:hypothetical protein
MINFNFLCNDDIYIGRYSVIFRSIGCKGEVSEVHIPHDSIYIITNA